MSNPLKKNEMAPPLRITGDSALARTMSKSNEWYTPPEYIKAVRQVLGPIKLDPASCKTANQIVQACNYYDLACGGLQQSWRAKTVYLNPPYGRDGHVSNQEIGQENLPGYKAGNIEQAILLVSAATDAAGFIASGIIPFALQEDAFVL